MDDTATEHCQAAAETASRTLSQGAERCSDNRSGANYRRRRSGPFPGTVALGEGCGAQWYLGLHGALGGNHDLPTPGDLLCAAVASCLDATIRTVADRLAIPIQALEVGVSAEADVRGALIVDPSVPVGFQNVRCCLRLRPATIQTRQGCRSFLPPRSTAALCCRRCAKVLTLRCV